MDKKFTLKSLLVIGLLGFTLISASACGQAQKKLGPKIPHTLEGREDCNSCHREGIAGAPKTPHPDRPNCTNCHKPQ